MCLGIQSEEALSYSVLQIICFTNLTFFAVTFWLGSLLNWSGFLRKTVASQILRKEQRVLVPLCFEEPPWCRPQWLRLPVLHDQPCTRLQSLHSSRPQLCHLDLCHDHFHVKQEADWHHVPMPHFHF